eukprot:scaffold194739_cov34-Prasinocladus_malaysianus.AAC.1
MHLALKVLVGPLCFSMTYLRLWEKKQENDAGNSIMQHDLKLANYLGAAPLKISMGPSSGLLSDDAYDISQLTREVCCMTRQ